MSNNDIKNGKKSGGRIPTSAVFALLAALVLVSYGGILKADFVYDDHNQLVRNVSIRSLRNIPHFFTDPAGTIGAMVFEGIYRPLRTTAFAIGYRLWALNPAAYHAVSLLFHLLNSFFVYLFIRRVSGLQAPALAAALLFAVHPAMTEAVCWICSQSDILCMFFYLAALLCWLESREKTGRTRIAFLAFSLASLVPALLSKEMAVTFVAIIIAIDFWREGLKEQTPKRWLEYAPFVVVTGVYLLIRINIMSRFSQRGYWGETPLASAVIIAKVVAYYIGKLVYPFNLTVLPVIETSVSVDFASVSAVVLTACLIAAALIFRRRYRLASLGIVLFFILLLPVSNIIPLTAIVADRFMYIPSLGFFLLTAALAGGLATSEGESSPKRTILTTGVFAGTILLFSINTIIRSLDWRNDFALFASAAAVAPANPRARAALGKEYLLMGDIEAARRQAHAALEHDARHAEARNVMGRIYLEEGRTGEAEREFKIVLESKPHDNYANNALGTMYKDQGRLDEALARFEAASNRQPLIWRTLNNAGSVLLELRRTREALDYFSRALEIKPNSPEAAYNKGAALVGLGRNAEAGSFLEDWMAENSCEGQLLNLLGHAYESQNNTQAGIDAYRRSLSMNPDDTHAAARLVNLHMNRGEYVEAAFLFDTILAEHFDSAGEHVQYATALEKSGRLDEAVEQLREAARLRPDDEIIRKMLEDAVKKSEASEE